MLVMLNSSKAVADGKSIIMATKRKPLHSPQNSTKFNFRPNNLDSPSWDTKGTKPIPEPSSVKQVLLMMILHVCRKTMFIDTNVKVGVYGACLFILSLVADVLPMPKTYFARSDNIFNQYFVKLGWGWTLMVTLPFIVLTSYTYCCSKRDLVMQHLTRLGVATASWYLWTNFFAYIETNYGRCNAVGKSFQTKQACLASGHFWHGFDMSGHAFILIYSSLVLIEESRVIIGWEGIKDLIMDEEHARSNDDKSYRSNPLKNLSSQEFSNLKISYPKFTPYIRILFIAMTCLTMLWDVMLVSTMLYYHIMIEKFVSGAIAILMWFFTYRYWYTLPSILPQLPGEGLFKYKDKKKVNEVPLRKRASTSANTTAKGGLPKFMGMPLYGLRKQENMANELTDESPENDNGPLPTTRV